MTEWDLVNVWMIIESECDLLDKVLSVDKERREQYLKMLDSPDETRDE